MHDQEAGGERESTGPAKGGSSNTDLNNWLPITASRKAKWWYAAFHNVTAMVGAGVLGLPYALSQVGWAPGVSALFGAWLITFYSLWQLIQMHEMVPGKRFDRYSELAMHVLGPNLGYWMVAPQQAFVQLSSNIVYMVTGGKSLHKFFDLLLPSGCQNIRQTYYILIFAVLNMGLAQTPNFNSLKGASLLAAVMSLCYSTIAFIASIVRGREHHRTEVVSYGLRSTTSAGKVFNILNAVGTIAFAYAGHSVVLEIQATMPSTEAKPSKKPMWKGVTVAYFIVLFCYSTVAVSGYWAYGNVVDDDVLISLDHPPSLIAIANLMVFVHVIGSYQVYAMPIYDLIESCLVRKFDFTPGRPLRLTARTIYVAFTCFVGMCLPFFGGLMGFFGGLFYTFTSFFLPCILWLVAKKPKIGSFHWTASWFAIIVGVSIALLAPIGGMREIIISAKNYRMFS